MTSYGHFFFIPEKFMLVQYISSLSTLLNPPILYLLFFLLYLLCIYSLLSPNLYLLFLFHQFYIYSSSPLSICRLPTLPPPSILILLFFLHLFCIYSSSYSLYSASTLFFHLYLLRLYVILKCPAGSNKHSGVAVWIVGMMKLLAVPCV